MVQGKTKLKLTSHLMALWVIILSGFLLRWEYAKQFSLSHLLEQVDPIGYHTLATHLLAGQGFCWLNESGLCLPNLIRTPAYPAFIAGIYALFGADPACVIAIQIGLDCLTCALIARLTYQLTHSSKASLVAATLYAFNPNAWLFASAMLTENLLSLVLIGLFALLLRTQTRLNSLSMGTVCALAVLIKPNLFFLPFLLIGCLLLKRVNWQSIGLVFVSCTACVMPWLIRNYQLVGVPTLSTAFMDNVSYVSAVATLFYHREAVSHPFTAEWDAVYYTDLVAVAGARYQWSRPIQSARDAYVQKADVFSIAQEIILTHPDQFLRSHWDGVKRAWSVHEHRSWYTLISGNAWGSFPSQQNVQQVVLLKRFWQMVHWVGLLGLGIGVWHLRRQYVLLIWVVGLAAGVTLVAGVLADMRFRFPVEAQLAIVMGIGLASSSQMVWQQIYWMMSITTNWK